MEKTSNVYSTVSWNDTAHCNALVNRTQGRRMTLTKVRDTGMNSYTWFWIDDNKKIVSPYFDSEEEAKKWHETVWDNWKAIK